METTKKIEDVRAYVEISVEKELPRKDKYGLSNNLFCLYKNKRKVMRYCDLEDKSWYYVSDGEICKNTTHWLKELSLTELMEEALNNISINYQVFDHGIWYDPFSGKQYSTSELLTEFLKTKGIL